MLESGGAEGLQCAVAELCISGNFGNSCPLHLPSCSELFVQCHSQSDSQNSPGVSLGTRSVLGNSQSLLASL